MAYPDYPTFIVFLDTNSGKYKNNPEPDGYNSTINIVDIITIRPEIANPEPQGTVPKPFTVQDTQALLSDESMGKLTDTWWASYTATLENENRENAKSYVINAEKRVDILPTESIAIQAELDSTILDPSWSATVPGDSDAMAEWDLSGFSSDYVNTALGR